MQLYFLRGQERYEYAWGATDRWNVVRRLRIDQAAPGLQTSGVTLRGLG